nr:MAG TPA: hypothetical protein [Caudoviricetes sp.]
MQMEKTLTGLWKKQSNSWKHAVKQADTPAQAGFIITDRKENIMKLTGYYMTAICKFEDGIKTICVVDAQNRAQMLERLKAAYPEQPFKLYDFERTKFSANVQSADIVDMRNLLNLADMDGVV